MARIFLALALFALALLAANIIAGFMTGDFNGAAAAHRAAFKKRDELRRLPGATPGEIKQQEEKLAAAGAELESLSGYKAVSYTHLHCLSVQQGAFSKFVMHKKGLFQC